MEPQQRQIPENSLASSEKCKLVTFVVVILCIVGYVGVCLRVLLSAQFDYPPHTVCDK